LYFQDKITENKENTAQLWKTINKILNHNSKSLHQIPQQICVNNKIVCDHKEISNAFNDYFVNVGNFLSSNISAITEYLNVGNFLSSNISAITDLLKYH